MVDSISFIYYKRTFYFSYSPLLPQKSFIFLAVSTYHFKLIYDSSRHFPWKMVDNLLKAILWNCYLKSISCYVVSSFDVVKIRFFTNSMIEKTINMYTKHFISYFRFNFWCTSSRYFCKYFTLTYVNYTRENL